MQSSFFSEASYFIKIILTFFIEFVCFLIFFHLGIILAMALFGMSYAEIESALRYSETLNFDILKYFQLLQTVSLFLIPSVIVSIIISSDWLGFLRLKAKPKVIPIMLVTLIMFVILPLIHFLSDFNASFSFPGYMKDIEAKLLEMQDNIKGLMEGFLSVGSFGGFLFNILLIAVLPAIGEEFFFRGILQRLFSGWLKNEHLGILFSAILFSIFHFQIFVFLPILFFGVFFGYLFKWSKNLWLPILAHFINNAIIVFYSYFFGASDFNKIERFGAKPQNSYYVWLSLIVVCFLIYLIFNYYRKLRLEFASRT